MAFKYCVVSYKPDIIAGELINIGIEIHDMDNLILYTKYTKDHQEISRRYGYSPVTPMVFAGLNQPPRVEDKDYLNKKHEKPNNGYERLFWSDVRGGILAKEGNLHLLDNVMKHLYDMFILIDKSWDSKS